MIERGANVNIVGNGGWTALMCIISNGDLENTKRLIDKGANVNLHERIFGNTPLIIAVNGITNYNPYLDKEDYIKIVKLLIDSGADIHAKNNEGFDFYDAAIDIKGGFSKMADWIEENIPEFSNKYDKTIPEVDDYVLIKFKHRNNRNNNDNDFEHTIFKIKRIDDGTTSVKRDEPIYLLDYKSEFWVERKDIRAISKDKEDLEKILLEDKFNI